MLFGLLLIYQLKHWVCDYPLQGQYMLGKFGQWPKWVLPLASHAAVHGLATYAIAYYVRPEIALWCALMDTVVHFVVDRLKASPKLGGRFKALSAEEYKFYAMQRKVFSECAERFKGDVNNFKNYIGYSELVDSLDRRFKRNVYFWWLLGLDQAAHHVTHYFIIWLLVR